MPVVLSLRMLTRSVGNYFETKWPRLLLALLSSDNTTDCLCVSNNITSLERENCRHILTTLDESPITLCKASDKYSPTNIIHSNTSWLHSVLVEATGVWTIPILFSFLAINNYQTWTQRKIHFSKTRKNLFKASRYWIQADCANFQVRWDAVVPYMMWSSEWKRTYRKLMRNLCRLSDLNRAVPGCYRATRYLFDWLIVCVIDVAAVRFLIFDWWWPRSSG